MRMTLIRRDNHGNIIVIWVAHGEFRELRGENVVEGTKDSITRNCTLVVKVTRVKTNERAIFSCVTRAHVCKAE